MHVTYRKAEELGLSAIPERPAQQNSNDQADDVLLLTEDEDFIHDNLLLINNTIVNTVKEKEHLYLKKFKSRIKTNGYYDTGVLDFTDVGGISKVNHNTLTVTGTVLTVTHKESQHSVILCLAGSLYNTTRISSTSFRIDLATVPYAMRMMDSSKYVDYVPMGLTFSHNGHTMSGYLSEEFIRELFSLDFTFIIIPNNELSMRVYGQIRSELPGKFLIDNRLKRPITNRHGVIDNYFDIEHKGSPGTGSPNILIQTKDNMRSAEYRHCDMHKVPGSLVFSDHQNVGTYKGYIAHWLAIEPSN